MDRLEKQKSQSGQALVEYVLLIAIASTLLLGLASQFYKPFGNYVKNQMGPYLECLLDVGELPSLGSDAGGECANEFKPFSPGGVASGSGSPPGNGRSNSSRDEDGNSRNNNPNSSGSGGNSTPSSAGGNSSAGRNKGFPIGNGKGADGPGVGKENQVIVEKLPESRFLKLRSAGGNSIVIQQIVPAVGINGLLAAEKVKIQRRQEASVKIGTLADSDSSSKAKRLLIKPTERKTASSEDEESWSFGGYFKFAVILMIIIAIILFLAGQVAQISKSMEK